MINGKMSCGGMKLRYRLYGGGGMVQGVGQPV